MYVEEKKEVEKYKQLATIEMSEIVSHMVYKRDTRLEEMFFSCDSIELNKREIEWRKNKNTDHETVCCLLISHPAEKKKSQTIVNSEVICIHFLFVCKWSLFDKCITKTTINSFLLRKD